MHSLHAIHAILTSFFRCSLLFGVINVVAQTPKPSDDDQLKCYPPGPDSKSQPGVPKGKTFSFQFKDSKIFPGTTREITVYIPAQYKGDRSACVYVGLDALLFDVPAVFDNLINRGEMPVTIAIGIKSGVVESANQQENQRLNRSLEFDSLNDSLARCIVEEIFPAVETRKTPDGLPIKLSKNPNDRCAGGASTGGIGAFTLAWERPDLFRRVYTSVGTFVGMRGGDQYPVLIRKTEPKPIRVFQQDGTNDEWMGGPEVGDWWMGNQTLERALEFAGYEHAHVWGNGTHNVIQGTAVFPEAMGFLWKDWPQPVLAHTAKTQSLVLQSVLDPDSPWGLVADAGRACDYLAVNPQGEIFFHDAAAKCTRKRGVDGQISEDPDIPETKAFGFGADGRVRVSKGTCLIVSRAGNIYFTESEKGKVWLKTPEGKKALLDQGLNNPTGIALSPDGLWLAVMESRTHWGYSYRVNLDGTVAFKQRFYSATVPEWADDSGAGGLCMDRNGYAYLATHMGIQIFDLNGRTRGILPMPEGDATSVCFGGANFDELFAISGGKLYQRHMKAVGAPSFNPPIKVPPNDKG